MASVFRAIAISLALVAGVALSGYVVPAPAAADCTGSDAYECCGLEPGSQEEACCLAPGSPSCTCYGLTGQDWDCCADPSSAGCNDCSQYPSGSQDEVCCLVPDSPNCTCYGLTGTEWDCCADPTTEGCDCSQYPSGSQDEVCCLVPGSTQCTCYGLTGDEWDCCADPTLAKCAGDCGGEPYPQDGNSYTCCAGSWQDSTTGECCPDDQWCSGDTGSHCLGRNQCFADACMPDAEWVCAVAVTHGCVDDTSCQDYCTTYPDDPCCAEPATCTGFCDYDFAYAATLTCTDAETDFEGDISVTYEQPCPTEVQAGASAQVAVTQNLAATGSMCGLFIGSGAQVDEFYFDLTFRDTCRNIAGAQETVPTGYTQTVNSVCCADGDLDQDGICDVDDPCDDIADADIDSVAARDAAGLEVDPMSPVECRCTSGGAYDPETNLCETDLCWNLEGDQDEAWLAANPDFLLEGNSCYCMNADRPKLCQVSAPVCIPDDECCQPDLYWYAGAECGCIPNDDYCGDCETGCQSGYRCCPQLDQCIVNADFNDTCLVDCDDFPPQGEYCTQIVNADGTYAAPWSGYPGNSLSSFFGGGLNAAVNQQTAARTSRGGNQPYYPIYGMVPQRSGNSCGGTVCDHGETCAMSVVTVGGSMTTDAECTPIECSGNSCTPLTGVMLEVVPSVIRPGESCFVLWASQGMGTVTIDGALPDESMRTLFAGGVEITPLSTEIYKIRGTAPDGATYEATDVCAVRPSFIEF